MKITKPITSIKDAFSVKGKNLLVTGGNGGIGFGIASAFAESGANVAIIGRNEEKCKKALEELRKFGTKCECYICDITVLDDVIKTVDKVIADFGRIDVLVNNAGTGRAAKLCEDEGLEKWHFTIETNLFGAANMIHAVGSYMEKEGYGNIINISSIAGEDFRSSMNNPRPAYHASKAAINNLTKYMAMEFRNSGITVNAVAPGLTHSELDKFLPPEIEDFVNNELPTRRWSEALEIGAACVYLASPAGAQVNGVVLTVDAGKRLVD